MKRKKFLALLLVTILITMMFSSCTSKARDKASQIVDTKLEAIINNPNPKVKLSSNPYDYINGSQEYKDIINLGDEALNYMLSKLKSSSENGLKEYIMACACSEILKESKWNWSTGKDWYNNYAKSHTK